MPCAVSSPNRAGEWGISTLKAGGFVFALFSLCQIFYENLASECSLPIAQLNIFFYSSKLIARKFLAFYGM